MTLVTTSRKPVPELRTFSKDLAFTLEASYKPRGKAGLGVVLDGDACVLVVYREVGDIIVDIYASGENVAALKFPSFEVKRREGPLVRGIQTGNQTVYNALKKYLDVTLTETGGDVVSFHGPQGRQYVLRNVKCAGA